MIAPGRQRGMTLYSIMVGTVIMIQALAIGVYVLDSTRSIKMSTQAEGRAVLEHRRNLEAIAGVLLAADPDTLANFDPVTHSTDEPWFERVTGSLDGERTLGGSESLEWRAGPPVAGMTNPGRVFHVSDDWERVVADRVEGGSFEIGRDGRTLTIRLKTCFVSSQATPVEVQGGTSITVRNGP